MNTGLVTALHRFFSPNQLNLCKKENELFRAIFQYSPDAYIIYTKATLEIIEVNRSTYDLLELETTINLKGLYMAQFMMRYLAGESPNLDRLMNTIAVTWKGEAEFLTSKKNRLYGWVNTNIFAGEKNDFEFQVLVIKNITEVANAKNEIRKSKALVEKAATSKANFLSSMSHELRTPLNGIIGTSNLILSEPSLQENIKKHVNVVRYSSEHMLNIINDILDFSKIDAKKMELKEAPFNLINNLNDLCSSFAPQYKSHNIALATQFPIDELQNINLVGDQMKLSQVINNLLSNALKFTVSGTVDLVVRLMCLSDTNATLYFEVKDTGIGIEKERQEEIFHAFTQLHSGELKRKYGGTGLGLTISQQLVNMLGGTLEVESVANEGSRFYFTLDFKVETASLIKDSLDNAADHVAHDIRGLRVLVVEDNEINANILKSFLRKWQMQIKVAITGIHALELIKYHKFDLVLMDLEMPEMNGYTALEKIRETDITTPVIAFTATMLENMETLITETGFTDYVLKPFRPSDLKQKIEKYCQRKIDYA